MLLRLANNHVLHHQCYSYAGLVGGGREYNHHSGIKATTKLLFWVKTHDSIGKRVQLSRLNCEIYLTLPIFYSNDTHHSKYPSYNTVHHHNPSL